MFRKEEGILNGDFSLSQTHIPDKFSEEMFRCVDIQESSNGISFTSFSSKTVLNCGFKMDYAINKLASWLFPFIKMVLSISAAVPGFEPEHSWTNTRTRTAAVSKLRKPRKDLERRA